MPDDRDQKWPGYLDDRQLWETLRDHEHRLRKLERFSYVVIGGLGFLAAEIPVAIAVVEWLSRGR